MLAHVFAAHVETSVESQTPGTTDNGQHHLPRKPQQLLWVETETRSTPLNLRQEGAILSQLSDNVSSSLKG